jgi:hypothetical protein
MKNEHIAYILHHILPFLMHIPYFGIFWHILKKKKKISEN